VDVLPETFLHRFTSPNLMLGNLSSFLISIQVYYRHADRLKNNFCFSVLGSLLTIDFKRLDQSHFLQAGKTQIIGQIPDSRNGL
jgi:hypothetical protein